MEQLMKYEKQEINPLFEILNIAYDNWLLESFRLMVDGKGYFAPFSNNEDILKILSIFYVECVNEEEHNHFFEEEDNEMFFDRNKGVVIEYLYQI